MISKKSRYPKQITLVVAPGISANEISTLKEDFHKQKTLVKNYDFYVRTAELGRGDRLMVVAPGIPNNEIKALRARFKEAVKDPSCAVVVNYDVSISVLSAGA